MKLCFASNNEHKLTEIRQIIGQQFELLSLADIGCHEELPEEQDTLEANSRQKAMYVWDNFGINCFADDTGLEVFALNGEPGVYSARYAGLQRNSQDNIHLLLQNLHSQTDRRAQFRTSITLILEGKEHQFDGIVTGYISEVPTGEKGFGYDPIFIPDGYQETFAQLPAEIKNKISHRGKAMEKLANFLQTLHTR